MPSSVNPSRSALIMWIRSEARTAGPRPEDIPVHLRVRSGSVHRGRGWRARALACGLVAVVAAVLVVPVGAQSRQLRGIFEVMVLARSGPAAAARHEWVDFR